MELVSAGARSSKLEPRTVRWIRVTGRCPAAASRLGVPPNPVCGFFWEGSFLISLLVLGHYDLSRLADRLFVPLWDGLSFLSTNR